MPPEIQVTCGPITAEPLDLPGPGGPPTRGKLVVPLTAAEKAQRVRGKAQASRSGVGGRATQKDSGAEAGGITLEAQEPLEFVHLKTPGRNYAVLQVSRFVTPWVDCFLSDERARFTVVFRHHLAHATFVFVERGGSPW